MPSVMEMSPFAGWVMKESQGSQVPGHGSGGIICTDLPRYNYVQAPFLSRLTMGEGMALSLGE